MAEKNNEWYTPAKYIEAARAVMNGIDLDPASCELANQTVKATRYYSKEDDGLSKEWHGRVWLNPPYGTINKKSVLGMFIERLITSHRAGDVEQAVLLATVQTNASWFKWLWDYPTCFVDHNIHFHLPKPRQDKWHKGRNVQGHMWGTVFTYLGPHEQKFVTTFSEFGRIARAIDTPRRVEKPIPLWDSERIYA